MSEKLPPLPESELPPKKPATVAVDPLKAKGVRFLHEKTAGYHIVHADGAWGSINSNGNAQLDFYVETAITPDSVIQPLDKTGNFSGDQIPIGRVDSEYLLVVRNMQCGIVLSLNSAMQIHSVLESFINSSKKQMEAAIDRINKPE